MNSNNPKNPYTKEKSEMLGLLILESTISDYPNDFVKSDSPDWTSPSNIGLEITRAFTDESNELYYGVNAASHSLDELSRMNLKSNGQALIQVDLDGKKRIIEYDLQQRSLRHNGKVILYDSLSDQEKKRLNVKISILHEGYSCLGNPGLFCSLVEKSFEKKIRKLNNPGYNVKHNNHLLIEVEEPSDLRLLDGLFDNISNYQNGYRHRYSNLFIMIWSATAPFNLHYFNGLVDFDFVNNRYYVYSLTNLPDDQITIIKTLDTIPYGKRYSDYFKKRYSIVDKKWSFRK